MFICLANHDTALKMLHHKLVHETIFSFMLADWFNIRQTTLFDQLAGSSHGVRVKHTMQELQSDDLLIAFKFSLAVDNHQTSEVC